ncbi:MAG: hypothetical protein HW400_552 [Candidatus Levybacteria bacterium]|nr:hypothetical protein [Candidatus Levybacteria bacterium]
MIKLSIVILSYNTKDLTLACLKSVASLYSQELEKKEFEIIIVENASSDGSPSEISNLKSQISNFKLIISKENLGFGKGCNLGAKVAKGKYLLFLNSDTQVLDNGFFSMVNFLDKNENVAILGGKLENNDGSAQRSCGKFYNLFNLLIMLLGFERFGFLRSSPGKIQKVDWVSGACMMVRSTVFEKLTGFDEKLFMYVEDMEICFRAKKVGFLTYFYPNLKLMHKSLGSSSKAFAIINIYKGILHFYSKYMTYLEYLIAKTLLITKAVILILVGFLAFNSELRNTYRKAIS